MWENVVDALFSSSEKGQEILGLCFVLQHFPPCQEVRFFIRTEIILLSLLLPLMFQSQGFCYGFLTGCGIII